jgi:hypothetical protein
MAGIFSSHYIAFFLPKTIEMFNIVFEIFYPHCLDIGIFGKEGKERFGAGAGLGKTGPPDFPVTLRVMGVKGNDP